MKNKKYIQPTVRAIQLIPESTVLVGSIPGLGIGDPYSGGEGG